MATTLIPQSGLTTLALIPVRGGIAGEEHLLAPGTYRVGSDPSCEIYLPLDGVAAQHCVITAEPHGAVVKTLSPLTWINDGVVSQSPLRKGDRLIVGPVQFVVRAVPTPTPVSVPTPDRGATAPTAIQAYAWTPPPLPLNVLASAEPKLSEITPVVPQASTRITEELKAREEELASRESSLREQEASIRSREQQVLDRLQQLEVRESAAADMEARLTETRRVEAPPADQTSAIELAEQQIRVRELSSQLQEERAESESLRAVITRQSDELQTALADRNTAAAAQGLIASLRSEIASLHEKVAAARNSGVERDKTALLQQRTELLALRREAQQSLADQHKMTLDLEEARKALQADAEAFGEQQKFVHLELERAEQLMEEVDRQRAKLAETELKLADDRRRVDALEQKLAVRDAAGAGTALELEERARRIAQREERVRNAELFAAEVETKRLELERREAELTQVAESLELELQRIEESRAEQNRLAAEANEHRRIYDESVRTLAVREEELQRRHSDVTNLAASLEDRQATIQSQLAAIADRERELSRIQADSNETFERAKAFASELEDSRAEVSRMTREQSAFISREAEMRSEREELRQQIGELKAVSLSIPQRIADQGHDVERADLARREQEIETKVSELIAWQEKLAAQEAELAAAAEAQVVSAPIPVSLPAVDESIHERQKELEAHEVSLRAREERTQAVEQQLTATRSHLEQAEQELNARRDEFEEERRQILKQQSEVDRRIAELAAQERDVEGILADLSERRQEFLEQYEAFEAERLKFAEEQTAQPKRPAEPPVKPDWRTSIALPEEPLTQEADEPRSGHSFGDRTPTLSEYFPPVTGRTYDEPAPRPSERPLASDDLRNEDVMRSLRAAFAPRPRNEPPATRMSLDEPEYASEEVETEIAAGYEDEPETSVAVEEEPEASPEAPTSEAMELRAHLADLFGIDLSSRQSGAEEEAAAEPDEPVEVVRSELFKAPAHTHTPAPPPLPTEPEPEPANDDVASYMERLLARTRRPMSSAPLEPPKPAPTPIVQVVEPEPIDEPVEEEPVEETPAPAQRRALQQEEREAIRGSMDSLRELANRTARAAVARHQLVKLKQTLTPKSMLAGFCGLISLILLIPELWGNDRYRLAGLSCICLAVISGLEWLRTKVRIRKLDEFVADADGTRGSGAEPPEEGEEGDA
jgi:hypothetical protein